MNKLSLTDLIAVTEPGSTAARRLLLDNNISLKPNELVRVAELLGRNPTLVELHIFNTMWSEHCSYKSSKKVLRKFLFTKAPHVVLGPGEDAGIVRFALLDGRSYCLVLAHESHNHPSQILPVEGAATGIGGIVRDVYCMGADVIGVMDPLRFGDPDGSNGSRTREIAAGVVDGIAQYANALGVPNLGGETVFDPSFDDNCLVNVVALGIVEESEIIRSRVPSAAMKHPYDVILIGKPTDSSGFGGAAFASERLSGEEAEENQGAVQVPDPFLKRVLAEATRAVLELLKERGLEIGFKDLGAGGISCAVSEMAAAGNAGVILDLGKVNVSSRSLPSEVIACSETQERYAMMVPASVSPDILKIYNEYYELPGIYAGAGAYVIGSVRADERFRLIHKGAAVCDADVHAITAGIEYERKSTKRKRRKLSPLCSKDSLRSTGPEPGGILLAMLSRDNIANKEIIYHHYDTEVQGRAVLRPGEADACVQVLVPGYSIGVAASIGGNSRLSAVDPHLGGQWAVIEAVRNVVCVGALPLALTDCLNYGDPEDPEVFWEFSEGVRGIGEACSRLGLTEEIEDGIPVVSGNVSFYNQSEQGKPIASSPIVSCAGRVKDIRSARGMGFKKCGSKIILVGSLHPDIGGSEFEMLDCGRDYPAGFPSQDAHENMPPVPDFDRERAALKAVLDGFKDSLLLAAHDISLGGLLVALSEMILASQERGIGCGLDLRGIEKNGRSPVNYLFSEFGGIIVETGEESYERFRRLLDKTGALWIDLGTTISNPEMRVDLSSGGFSLCAGDLSKAKKGRLGRIFGLES